MPRKKQTGKKSGRKSGSRKKPGSFFSNLIFFSSLAGLLVFAGWITLLYLPLEKFLAKNQQPSPGKPISQTGSRPDPEAVLAQKGQKLLLKTQMELTRSPSIFQRQPVFSDCPVDEHYLNCLEMTFFSDTDFILAEKSIRGLWESEAVTVNSRPAAAPKSGLILAAMNGSHRLAEIVLSASAPPGPAKPGPARPAIKPRSKSARVAIVIDDLGDDYQAALELARIPGPIAMSILPFESKSQEVLELAKNYHKPALLHMPMEPLESTGKNPGPEALLILMSPEQVTLTLGKALDSLPGIAGVNNHMGSAFTAMSEMMDPVLKEINRRGLFFLDSRTSGRSVGYQLGQELGMKICERKIFLDNLQDPEMIAQKLAELCRIAKEEGFAIGIGHPYPETIRVLGERIDLLKSSGCELTPIQELCR